MIHDLASRVCDRSLRGYQCCHVSYQLHQSHRRNFEDTTDRIAGTYHKWCDCFCCGHCEPIKTWRYGKTTKGIVAETRACEIFLAKKWDKYVWANRRFSEISSWFSSESEPYCACLDCACGFRLGTHSHHWRIFLVLTTNSAASQPANKPGSREQFVPVWGS